MIIYGLILAPAVRKVMAFLCEKGPAAEYRPVAPHDPSPEFRRASPLGQIPALSDGAFCLADSTAICHYLERRFRASPFFPADAGDYGRMVWFDQFADGALGAVECTVVTNRVLSKLRSEAPELGAVTVALERALPPLYDYLEGEIAAPFLVGDCLTLADLAVASPFVSLRIAGHAPDATRWPRLRRYLAGILGRPAFVALPHWAPPVSERAHEGGRL
ncbi:MAG TPA: glutathione S-transferase family protein [Stellaceae bacterium]|nr:glutathione S-transferase family protein [Stellaceae bacterium]